MGEKELDGLNVRNSDVQNVPLLPAHQAGRGQGTQFFIESNPQMGQEMVGSCMGHHAFYIPAYHNQSGADPRCNPPRGGGGQPAGAGQEGKGAKPHQPHLRQVSHYAGQGGESELPFHWGG